MRNRNRLVLGLVIGVAVFAAAFGMAASLGGIDSDTLGADDQVVAACHTSAADITTRYATVYNATGTAGYKVDSVTLDGVDAACEGLDFKITLSGGTAQEVTGSLTLTSGSATIEFDNTKLAEEVTGVHVVISG